MTKPRDRSRIARKGWARRRLRDYLRDIESWLGYVPKCVTVWADDFDLLGGEDERIELRKGPPKPACESRREAIHR